MNQSPSKVGDEGMESLGMLVPSARSTAMNPFIVMDIMEKAREVEAGEGSPHGRVLHLEVGQPSCAPPKQVLDSLTTVHSLPLGYTTALGLPELRDAITNHYQLRYSVSLKREHIAITTGASGAFLAVFTSCFDAGDRVAFAAPGYPCYTQVLMALNVTTAVIPTTASTNFQPSCPQLQAMHKEDPISGVILASPSNPTGSVLSLSELLEIAQFCKEERIHLIVDEIYHGISRSHIASALQSAYEGVIVIGSFSKYWCMTGFRVGWAIVRNANMMSAFEKCMQNMAICAPTVSQRLAIVAISGICDVYLDTIVKSYFDAAETLVRHLRQAGFICCIPNGAFYVYANCKSVCSRVGVEGSLQLCHCLLYTCAIACTPGLDFDAERGHDYIRFSCASSFQDVDEAGNRLVQYLLLFDSE